MTVPDTGSSFVGREAELFRLRECASGTREGQPWMVLVEGEAGVGKTALVRQWLGEPQFKRFIVLRASADVSEQDLALGVLGQLLRTVPARVVENYPLLSGVAPTAAPFQVGTQFLALLGRLQSDGPVALVVDDVQWADEESLRVLGLVGRRLEADRVLTVLVARSGQQSLAPIQRLVTDRKWSYHLVLKGMQSQEVAQLAEHVLGHTVGAWTAERLREHTNGNALYVSTLLAEFPDVVEQGRERLPVPSSLAGAVVRQLAGLPGETRQLVEAASVLDARSPLALVAEVAQVPDAVGALEPALEAGLLRWWPNEPTTPVAVNHALQAEVIKTAINPTRRQALHAAAAPLVDRAASWAHRVASAGPHDSRLVSELEAEALQQADAGAAERAATLLVWASDLAATRAEHDRLLLTAATRLTWADKFAQVEKLLPAIRSCAPSSLRSLALGAYAMSRGTAAAAEAEAELTNAFATAEKDPDLSWVAAKAGFRLGWLYYHQARYEESLTQLSNALAFEGIEEHVAYRAAGQLCVVRGCLQSSRAALEEFSRVTHAIQADEHTQSGMYLTGIRGQLRVCHGELTRGAGDLATALRLAHVSGYPVLEEVNYTHLSYAQYWLGEWDKAVINADHAVTAAATEDRPWVFPFVYAASCFVWSGRGEWDRAEELLTSIREWAGMNGSHFEPYASISEAILAQAKEDYPAMLNALRAILRQPERGWSLRYATWWRPLHAQALIGSGLLDEADRAVAALQSLSKETAPHLRTATAWLSGWLAQRRGDLEGALALYKQGLALTATQDEPPLHRALLKHAHGRLLSERGAPAGEVADWLRQAHGEFAALGAAPFAARCSTDLGGVGVAPSAAAPAAAGHLPELTAREHDIARLVSRGLTNKEIAGDLFISTKTVEYHLGHIYAKLHLTNRRQLRDRVERRTKLAAH